MCIRDRQNSATVARILDGALRALARRGRHKLSMSDVGELSGISRGTLYRYFRNKQEILDAIAAHVRDSLLKQLTSAIEDRPELDVRVQVVTEALVGFSRTHPEAIQVIALEPEFNVNAVRNLFPEFAMLLEELLTPALELTPAVRSNAVTPGELSELILRVAGSTYFIPPENFDEMPLTVAALPCLNVSVDGT